MKLVPGDVLETDAGEVAVTGCESWPCSDVGTSTVSAVDDTGAVRFVRWSRGEWVEVMRRG